MRRQFIFGTMLTAALAVGAGAQEPGQTRASGQGNRNGQTVTVAGCLQAANRPGTGAGQTATGGDTTSRQQGDRAAGGQYILTNASMSSTGAGTSGTGGTGTGATGTGAAGTGAGTGAAGTGTGAAGTGTG